MGGEVVEAEYKQTEVGVIPEDWASKKFEDVMTGFTSGQTPSRSNPDYFKGEIPWITSTELNYNIVMDTIEKITEDAVKSKNLKILPKGTFLFAISGLEAEGTRGKCAITGIKATTNQSCMALFPNEELKTKYLFYYYEKFGNWLAFTYCQGTKQQSFSGKIARIFPIVYPPTIEEQTAIAAALSDVDAFISALDRLISKKRAIKQGAMQELLTGKKRLPGFEGEWEAKQLGDVASIRNQKILSSNVDPEMLCVELKHIGQGNGQLLAISTAQNSTSSKYRFFSGDVLFGRLRSYLRKFWHADRDGICTTEIWPLMVDASLADSGFLYLIIQSDRFIEAASISYGTHMPRADWNVMKKIEISLPPRLEQTAIASVLSDMDAEITALEQKRDKALKIKEGMMQELLAGRTRLV